MSNFPDFSLYGYDIVRELGHNRAGGRVTYLATQINTSNPVVLKQFQFTRTGASWAEYEAYEREIKILEGLNHPNIPRYLDSFPTPTGFCMVQEYKLADSLAIKKSWTPQQVKQIAIAVLDILKYLQNLIPPIIHRDLKPENILVDEKINVYLVDFGFAHIGSGEVAVSSVVKGTLGFMPPEQMFNRQLTPASDLYSLGATLICLLTETPSPEISTLIDYNGRINFQDKLAHLNPLFLEWLTKMVEPKYQERYESASLALNVLIPLKVLPTKNNQIVTKLLPLVGGGLISLLLLFTLVNNFISLSKNPQAVTVTTNPENLVNQNHILLKPQRVYFAINLSNLSQKQYHGVCQLVDGYGRVLAFGQVTLTPSNNELKAWCWYDIDTQVDLPGDWQFIFFLEGKKVIQKQIEVTIANQ